MAMVIDSKEQQAKYLARTHKKIEPGTMAVFRLLAPGNDEDDADEPVKLLEVTKFTIPAGIRPLYFPARAEAFPFPTVIVEITPKEFQELKRNKLALPHGWTVGSEIVLPKRKPRG